MSSAPKERSSAAPSFNDVTIARYADLWQRMTILPSRLAAVQLVAHKIIGYKDRYRKLELSTGIPWFLIGCLHYRESDCNFHCHLHNGDPLTRRTVQVPAGRPKGEPPFTWEESALDALTMRGLENIHQWSLEMFGYQTEGFNGWGYFYKGLTSSYLWAGTTDHELGKYTSDGHYDPQAQDQEVGVMAILKVLMELDPTITFKSNPQSVPVVRSPTPPATQVSPIPAPPQELPTAPAEEAPVSTGASPVAPARTGWAVVIGTITSLGTAVGQAIDSLKPILSDPKVVAVLVAVALLAGGVILWEHLQRKPKLA